MIRSSQIENSIDGYVATSGAVPGQRYKIVKHATRPAYSSAVDSADEDSLWRALGLEADHTTI
jgi:hypothetical protein